MAIASANLKIPGKMLKVTNISLLYSMCTSQAAIASLIPSTGGQQDYM
jgi:hypothetical protein